MTDPKEPKKRGGRPLRDPDEGVARYHLGLRYTDRDRDQLMDLMRFYNSRLREMGLPPTVTVSSMVKRWIDERLQAEMEKWKPPHVENARRGAEAIAEHIEERQARRAEVNRLAEEERKKR